ncbi:AraC family transcriptional regulator [Gracilibacillus kekensis]|uniref:AraC-type DNA-binding protein n=1 Tax=Gracilibacillus kekensis TaxID=1027249 RepID=A0A1M7QVI5_9BACI|nr:AraC family transcriptional regulator [Gracilibacillus kekensis]SHN35959.1 AraC-type DNA-binding protein [Gracilibacillus kekensis]
MNNKIEIINSNIALIHEIGIMDDCEGILKHPNRIMPDLNVFVYVINGKLQINEDGKSYILEKGSYLFLRKNAHHWGEDYYQPGSEWYYIHFFNHSLPSETSEYSPYGKTSLINQDEYQSKITLPKFGTVSQRKYIISQLDKLLEMFESSHPLRPMLTSMQLHQFFLELYLENLESFANKKSNRMIIRMINYIDGANKKVTSQEIADHLGMNYAYLSTLFKEYTGKSVTQYQNEKMIEKAIQLFRKENVNVAEVSEQLGFSNPFYFSRVFKKVTGLSPSAYLQQIYRY